MRSGETIRFKLNPGVTTLGNKALKLTLRTVDCCRGCLCGSMIATMGAGFPEPGLLKGLESRRVPDSARIRKNDILDRMAHLQLTQPAGASGEGALESVAP